jgi:TatD DNase family protein
MPSGPIELPRLGAQTADTHAHLDMLDDPAGALERASIAGVMLIVNVADLTESPENAFEHLEGWLEGAQQRLDDWEIPHGTPPQVRVIVGTHPHNAKSHTGTSVALLEEYAANPLTVGVGEIGLDFHYDHSPRDVQARVFEEQLAFACDSRLPVVIHLRDAFAEGVEIMERIGLPEAGCVMHCFTADTDEVREFLDMGCHISIAGPVTFKKADPLRTAVVVVPADRLLVETDAPFLAPEPHRGRPNEPAFVTLTVERIARLRGERTDVIARATMKNARRVFNVLEADGTVTS